MLLLLTGAKQPWMSFIYHYYIPFPSLGLPFQLKTDNNTAYISKYVI